MIPRRARNSQTKPLPTLPQPRTGSNHSRSALAGALAVCRRRITGTQQGWASGTQSRVSGKETAQPASFSVLGFLKRPKWKSKNCAIFQWFIFMRLIFLTHTLMPAPHPYELTCRPFWECETPTPGSWERPCLGPSSAVTCALPRALRSLFLPQLPSV